MIISCPNCDTAYNLSENAITSEGRKIRCKRCRHVFWARRLPTPAGSEPKIEIYYKDQEDSKEHGQKEAPQAAPPKAVAPASSPIHTKETKEAPRPISKLNFGGSRAAASVSAPPKEEKPKEEKPSPLDKLDKKEVRNTLGELFGSSINALKEKEKAKEEEKPAETASANAGHETARRLPNPSILSKKTTPPSSSAGDTPLPNLFGSRLKNKEPSHATSFGMPAVTEKDREELAHNPANDPPRATSLGIPSLKTNLAPPQEDSSRKRQSTLWMLSDDEANPSTAEDLSEKLEKSRNSVAQKLAEQDKGSASPSEADFSDIVDIQNDKEDEQEAPDPSNQTSPLLSFDRASLKKELGDSPIVDELAQNIAAQKPWSDGKNDRSSEFEREESGRRNTTLFGLAAPISSNTTRYDEEDAAEFFNNDIDFDDFFNLDNAPNLPPAELEIPDEEYEKNPSNAESVVSLAYTEPLKPSEKDTARRLAMFLGRMSAARKEEDDAGSRTQILGAGRQHADEPSEVTRDVSREFNGFPTSDSLIDQSATATATVRDERPPFELNDPDPIEADLSVPMGGVPPNRLQPMQGGPQGGPPSRGGRPTGGFPPAGGYPNASFPNERPPIDNSFGATPGPAFGAQPNPSFGAAHQHTQPRHLQEDAWGRPSQPIPGPGSFDRIENTDIIPRESPQPSNEKKSGINAILLWGLVIAIVIAVGLLVAWFIVMKLL